MTALVPVVNHNNSTPASRSRGYDRSAFGEAARGLPTAERVPRIGSGLPDAESLTPSAQHVLNFTDEPLRMHGRFNLYLRAAAETPHLVNGLNCLNQDVEIPPKSDVSITASCTVPHDLDLVMLASHAHQYLQRFEIKLVRSGIVDPDPVYVSTDWDSPLRDFLAEPIALKMGDGLQFTCHYSNPTEQRIEYGLGVYNEMCAVMSVYSMPAAVEYAPTPPLGTVIVSRETPAPLFDTTQFPIAF